MLLLYFITILPKATQYYKKEKKSYFFSLLFQHQLQADESQMVTKQVFPGCPSSLSISICFCLRYTSFSVWLCWECLPRTCCQIDFFRSFYEFFCLFPWVCLSCGALFQPFHGHCKWSTRTETISKFSALHSCTCTRRNTNTGTHTHIHNQMIELSSLNKPPIQH